ncbi:MAG: SNF2 helicase associated domain-containing protein [Clostridia bacterium]|nr:SNF2 helicase associated domain-containing protein [Clostridia bacterium]
MLINAEEINKILLKAGSDIINKGKKCFEQGKVKIASFEFENENNYVAKSYIESSCIYEIEVNKKNGILHCKCDCPFAKNGAICRHVVAVFFNMYINSQNYFDFEKRLEAKEIENDITYGKESRNEIHENNGLIKYYENLELGKKESIGTVRLVPVLSVLDFRQPELEVSFKIGKDRKYLLKDIYKFSEEMLNEEVVKYGKELEFKHNYNAFSEDSKKLVEFLTNKASEYNEFSKLGVYTFNLNRRYRGVLKLKYGALDEFFNLMLNQKIQIDGYAYEKCFGQIEFVDENPKLEVDVIDNQDEGISVINDTQKYYIFYGQQYVYILYKEHLYRCNREFKQKVIPLLVELDKSNGEVVTIEKNNATSFCEYMVPSLKEFLKVNLPEGLLDKYKAEKLGTKIYLDIEKNGDIVAEVKFCYGDIEFNPFDQKANDTCNRNLIEETKAKELFKRYKFIVNYKKGVIYLSNEDDIYEFLSDGINVFMQKFEVLVTDRLRNKQIINPKMVTMGVRIQNEFLEISFEDLGVDEVELKEIFRRYRLKKKYYRLKDGSYINIDSSGIDTLANISNSLNLSEKEIIDGNIKLPKYRSIYLDNIVRKNNSINIKRDNSFKEVVRSINDVDETDFEVPTKLQAVLRAYQKTGFSWLKTLEKYNFGGILADDMGLGKTIQIIALLIDEKNKTGKTSLVVCPSSLYINWKKEINKFAPQMKILVVSGSAEQREKLIKTANQYDAVITSYDLLKRDVEKYSSYTFKYIIADEAQYIKNNNTKNAKALKKLKSEVRFALTGTPIENSLAELWSIFDFIMPGYLFSYKKFKEEYETPIIKDNDVQVVEKLQKLVAPFILRRIKSEVLKELPEKTETIMYSEMDKVQEKLYKAYLASSKKEITSEIEENGFEKSKFKILSIITRLRQICCHPSLFISEYDGESAKLNQCLEIIEGAIAAGHKILLFSGFTSMFDIITKELEKRGIEYSMLTGQTKVDTRIEMVEEFNRDENIKVFLISLKAGGTGLNLTGADIVIHYDPWWNLSAQNQATDRAYRIGQRNNVQVFKLITSGSIEEKIQKLQEKKINLSDSIIKSGETFINKMSKEDIIELFEE